MSEHDEKFDQIVQQALDNMTNVKCDNETYKTALRAAIEEFEIALEAAS